MSRIEYSINAIRSATSTEAPRVYGRHVFGNLYDCDVNILSNEEKLRETVIEAAKIGNMTLLDVKSWRIGYGVSVVAVVLESHITIHTWPEYGFATVDVYSCGMHTNPDEAFNYIVNVLKPKRVEKKVTERHLE